MGEILELPAFQQLCQSVGSALEDSDNDIPAIAAAALSSWRQAQALVLVGQFELIGDRLDLATAVDAAPAVPKTELPVVHQQTSEKGASARIVDAAPSESESVEATIRVPARYLEQVSEIFGELNAERNDLTLQLQRMEELVKLLAQRVQGLEQNNSRLRNAYDRLATQTVPAAAASVSYLASSNFSDFDALEMDRYGELHVLSREIVDSVVQLQEVTGDIETALTDTTGSARALGQATKMLQANLEKVRMRPLSDLFDRFPRLLRELSLAYGKQVDLSMQGGAILLERSVLDMLSDPLLHLLRNAFDHGIESAEMRLASGKSERGRIEISAGYRGSQTTIVLRDDGGGISLQKIRDRAERMGLTATDLANLHESEMLELIFEPGFSTAERVTDLSGRGVGLDVVLTNLRAIGGDVKVKTAAGKGTTFTLSVPTSLAIARVLLVESNNLTMAVPVGAVEAMLLEEELEFHTVAGQEAIRWEEYSVPLVRMRDRLQYARPQRLLERETVPKIDKSLVLVVAHEEAPYALLVDRYWGEQEVTTRAVQSELPLPAGFTGCAVLGGDRIVPILDVEGFLAKALSESTVTVPTPPLPIPPPSFALTASSDRAMVMVVDDSINVRRFLAITLEKAGYRVEQAKDGLEALEKLRAGGKPGAVVCDIEMPRLDGFGFLAQAKADADLRGIPIVMLTSRSGIKHRDLALRLGASHYFSKPFREQELLQTLAQLTSRLTTRK